MREIKFNIIVISLSDYSMLMTDCPITGDEQAIRVQIHQLIKLGSVCYDFNQGKDAIEIYKKIVKLCIENENDSHPQFKSEALIAASHIQHTDENRDWQDEKDNSASYLDWVNEFYNKRFSFA